MMERMEKMMIWMVAPPAYQYGPLIPYCKKRDPYWFGNIIDSKSGQRKKCVFYVYRVGALLTRSHEARYRWLMSAWSVSEHVGR